MGINALFLCSGRKSPAINNNPFVLLDATLEKSPDSELIELALERFNEGKDFWEPQFKAGQEDYDFAIGKTQWPEKVKTMRERESRPCLTENRMMTFVNHVINDIRKARPAINVKPVDDKADKEVAKILQGMVRNIEVLSSAETVYDTAAESAIMAGVGFFRVTTDYADSKSFDQEIKLERILDFKSVIIDPNIKTLDGSDAEWAFVYTDIPRKRFEKLYPDADPVSFDKNDGAAWCDNETVRIAEYFYKEYEAKRIALLSTGETVDYNDAINSGAEIVNERQVEVPTIKWCQITKNAVLKKTKWLGKFIPIIPVFGKELYTDGKRAFQSFIFNGKDSQQMNNFWLSASAEIIAYQPRAPFIALSGKINQNSRKAWEKANTNPVQVLEYDAVEIAPNQWDTSPPQRQLPPQGSPTMIQERLNSIEGMKATLGLHDASLGNQGNETSGRAILARQAQGNNATFHFVDNLAKSVAHAGRIVVDLIPKIYKTAQITRIIGIDGEPLNVPINQNVIKGKTEYYPVNSGKDGDLVHMFLDFGKYDVVCSMGASYQTKRQESADAMLELTRSLPAFGEVAGDLIVKSMDFPDADVISERLASVIPAAQNDVENPEKQALQQAQQQIAAMSEQMQQMDEALKAKSDNEQLKTQIEQQKLQLEAEKLQLQREQMQITAQLEAAKMQQAAQQTQANDIRGAFDTVQKVTNGLAGLDGVQALVDKVSQLEQHVSDVYEATSIQLDHEEERQSKPVVDLVPQLLEAIQSLKEKPEPKKEVKDVKFITDRAGKIVGAKITEQGGE